MEVKVILVSPNDEPIGEAEKMDAHRKGLLHRAVSVFIFNNNNEMLLQRRALDKYHSPGLWTNAACTHPYPNESAEAAGVRRVKEELGIEMNQLTPLFQFLYHEELEHEMWEHEYDHVYFGTTDEVPNPNPEEVAEYKYININDLLSWMEEHPEEFTVWFKKIAKRVVDSM